MSGLPPDRVARRLPSGLLGMLALVAVVEAAIEGHRADLVSAWVEDWRVTARAAGTKVSGCDVLCFGDSLVKYGILPKVIRAKAGLRSYNLATSGGTMPSAFFLLRRALDSGARPKAVLIDFDSLMPGDDGPSKLLNYPDLATFRDGLDLAWTSGSSNFFGPLTASKVLPSYHFRFEIRSSIRASLDGRSSSDRNSVKSHATLWSHESGAQPTERVRFRHPRESLLIDAASPEDWACEPTNRAYLERFLDLAESRAITVYWLMPPLAPEVERRRIERGSKASYDRFVRTIVARHPDVVVLDARTSGYDDSVHIDYLHLDRRGATVLSHDVASVLASSARAPAGSGWVDLPPFAGRGGEGPTSAVARSRSSAPR